MIYLTKEKYQEIEAKINNLIKEANLGKTLPNINSQMAESLIKFKEEILAQSTILPVEENWKDIPNYIGLYQVSNLGKVKALSRILTGHRQNKFRPEKFLKPEKIKSGYLRASLSKNGNTKSFLIHQLVAITFLNHVINGHNIVVDHIDNNKENNRLSNLQLLTNRENVNKNPKGISSFAGVSKTRDKWKACIKFENKIYHLSVFNNEIEASKCYQKALNVINSKNREEILEYLNTQKRVASSKHNGISFNNQQQKWTLRVVENGKRRLIGYFETEELALNAKIKYYENTNS